MTIPLCSVTVSLNDQGGSPIAGAKVVATLDRTDRYGSFVVPRRGTAPTDSDGLATLALFPNVLGAMGSRYRFTATDPETGKRALDVYATVPNEVSVALSDIADTSAPAIYPALVGATRIEVVSTLPSPQVPGVIYFVTG